MNTSAARDIAVDSPTDGQNGYLIGIDMGGTFTDIVAVAKNGKIVRAKVLSPGGASTTSTSTVIAQFLQESGIEPPDVLSVIHGTTVATNAILEGKGAVTGLLTTSGFRDVLEIGRLSRPALFEMDWNKPRPIVPRRLRVEVDERISHSGRVLAALDTDQARRQVQLLRRRGVRSVAVAFLHSYADASHEKRLGELIAEMWPDTPVSLSSDVLPEIREYERTSTTVVNAYVRPIVDRYLSLLERDIVDLGIHAPLLVMQSNGGVTGFQAARESPVTIIESGPAAGVLAASYLAKATGLPDAIALDMGGTTAKASMIESAKPKVSYEYEVGGGQNRGGALARGGGYPIRVPCIDVVEVGNGGGSIAYVDAGGVVRVGPHSAGADPGPACYGRGNCEPTVTDANVVLGYMNPGQLAGGRLAIDGELARKAVRETIADPLGLDVPAAAHGIHLLTNANIVQALRGVTTERGRSPSEFTLVAFGGCGPMHAATLASAMGMRTVVVPIAAGLFSTVGLLFADVRHDFVQTFLCDWGDVTAGDLERRYGELLSHAAEELQRLAGLSLDTCRVERLIDLRLRGQGHELSVLVNRPVDVPSLASLRQRFEEEYRKAYGHLPKGDPEIVHLRLEVTRQSYALPYEDLAENVDPSDTADPSAVWTQTAYFGPDVGSMEVDVLAGRARLGGQSRPGPFVVEEPDCTTLVPPGCTAYLDEYRNIVIQISGSTPEEETR